MTSSVKIASPNSLLFIAGIDGGKPPVPVLGEQILATESCVSIACYPWIDGETAVTLGPGPEVDPGTPPVFDGKLETPSRTIIISTVDKKTILSDNVSDTRTRIRTWVNRPTMPDQVIVGFD